MLTFKQTLASEANNCLLTSILSLEELLSFEMGGVIKPANLPFLDLFAEEIICSLYT